MSFIVQCTWADHEGDLQVRRKVYMVGTVEDMDFDGEGISTKQEEETTDDDYTEEFLCGVCFRPLDKTYVLEYIGGFLE